MFLIVNLDNPKQTEIVDPARRTINIYDRAVKQARYKAVMRPELDKKAEKLQIA